MQQDKQNQQLQEEFFTSGMGGVYAGQAIATFLKTNEREALTIIKKMD